MAKDPRRKAGALDMVRLNVELVHKQQGAFTQVVRKC